MTGKVMRRAIPWRAGRTLLSLVSALLLGCSPPAWAAHDRFWSRYASPDGQFSLAYPAAWRIGRLAGHGVAFSDPTLPLTEFTYGHGYALPRPMSIYDANLWWLRLRQGQYSGYHILDQLQVSEGDAYFGLDVLARFPRYGRTFTERYFIYVMNTGAGNLGDTLNVYFTYTAPLPEYYRYELDIFLPMLESLQRSLPGAAR